MWKKRSLFICSVALLTSFAWLSPSNAIQPKRIVAGFNLTEWDGFPFDANLNGGAKTNAQKMVDEMKRLGTNHVELNVRAKMIGPFSNEVIPITSPAERALERQRITRLIQYIHSLGMTAGIRPIFFVVGPNGEFPFFATLPNGSLKMWWHGNIQPADPNRWFDSFKTYLNIYATVAQVAKADFFTIGAELYSMTVGIEDQWPAYPYGFPGRWLEILRLMKRQLPNSVVMYDINFTDDRVDSSRLGVVADSGGELERWRYRLVDLANPSDPEERKIWLDLVTFWKELDAVGIDMYRSLAGYNDKIPTKFEDLVNLLNIRSNAYAAQLDTILTRISLLPEINMEKKAILKEIGFRSVEKGFIDPFNYAGTGEVNLQHQATAYESIFEAFWAPGFSWFGGIDFWDVPIDPAMHGPRDRGFSPIQKNITESVIIKYYKN